MSMTEAAGLFVVIVYPLLLLQAQLKFASSTIGLADRVFTGFADPPWTMRTIISIPPLVLPNNVRALQV